MAKIDRAIPLIVCGRQRAGTRFITNALNSFDEVTLQGELPNPVMRSAIRFVQECDAHYQRAAESGSKSSAGQLKMWQRKRVRLMFEIWSGASQAVRMEATATCRYFGYKRPNNEQFFDFYEDLFREPKARYVYCIRNFEDNYLSIVSRWPDRTIGQVAEDYLSSVAQFEVMKAAAPDRVFLFNLDEHIRSGWTYVEAAILRPLGLEPRDAQHRDELASAGPVNTAESITKMPKRKELTEEERLYLAENPAVLKRYRELTGALAS